MPVKSSKEESHISNHRRNDHTGEVLDLLNDTTSPIFGGMDAWVKSSRQNSHSHISNRRRKDRPSAVRALLNEICPFNCGRNDYAGEVLEAGKPYIQTWLIVR